MGADDTPAVPGCDPTEDLALRPHGAQREFPVVSQPRPNTLPNGAVVSSRRAGAASVDLAGKVDRPNSAAWQAPAYFAFTVMVGIDVTLPPATRTNSAVTPKLPVSSTHLPGSRSSVIE